MKQSLFSKHPLLTFMKITIIQCFLIALCSAMAFARPIKAQQILNREVSVKMSNVTLKAVLQEIEKQTNVHFVYSNNAVQTSKNVSLQTINEPLITVLPKLLSPNQLRFEVVEEQIVLKKIKEQSSIISEEKESMSAITEDKVTGKVTSEKGEKLPGVSVLVKGTSRGTVTNNEGEFNVVAKEGDVLVLSFVGFEKQEVKITSANQVVAITLKEDVSQLNEVVVIGSRAGTARTDVERPVPVDILSAKELQSTGQTELGQQVQFMSPSFNAAKNGINGVAGYADPASLKGLSPDQMLVLVNGKRRHQFAAVQNNVTVGKGTVITDLNSIPSLALERMEILRDGAAAQYGSDAIAGIANLVLKKSVNSGTFQIQSGATAKGDGGGYTVGLNYGFSLGKKASLNLTGSWQDVSGTDRSDPYNPEPIIGGAYAGIYASAAVTATAAAKATAKTNDQALLKSRGYWGDGTYGSFRISKYGSNAMKSGQLFYNLDVPLNKEWSLYSFGGYSNKEIVAGAFLRTAIATAATSNVALYPDGYNPSLPATVRDYSTVVGIQKKTSQGWNIDFSTGYGYSFLDQNALKSANASLGANSPKDFYAGRTAFGQSLTELNFSKALQVGNLKSFNLALGAQYRVDNFSLSAGDPASYEVGPLAKTNGKTPGSQGRVGIDILDVKSVSRSNLGMYADVETDISSKLLIAAALRYENYSDFGGNVSGKLATRLKLNDYFSLRGSINRGFRAPVLQQIANAATTSTVQSGLITSTKQLSSDEPLLKQVGIEDPQPETSWNYNLGITAQAGRDFLFTLDAYQIDIDNRIIITENLKVASVASLTKVFGKTYNEITFFTNAINTQTQGVDLVASYKKAVGKSKFTASLALTVNKTTITGVKDTPALLQQDTKAKVILIDTISRSLIETSQPHTKVLASVGYQVGKVAVTLRGTYFGEVTAWEKLTVPNAGTSNLHQAQTFGGKTIFDASVAYNFNKTYSLTIGSNNFTDVYPDKVNTNYASYTNGQVPYSRNVNQFGFNGAYYYGTLTIKL